MKGMSNPSPSPRPSASTTHLTFLLGGAGTGGPNDGLPQIQVQNTPTSRADWIKRSTEARCKNWYRMEGDDDKDHFRDLEMIRERCSAINKNRGRNGPGGEDTGTTLPTPVCTIKDHTNDVTSVDFSGRSLLATGSSDKSVRLYKWQVGDKFAEVSHSPLLGHTYGVNYVNFSPFGSKLASASIDGSTIIWDVKSGERLCSLQPASEAAVRVCAFSPNSALLATGGDDDLAGIWDVSTLSLLRRMCGDESTVTSLSFTPDSCYLATGSSGGELRVWDARYGHSVALAIKAEAHDLGVCSIHFSPSIGKESSGTIGKQYLLASGGQDTELHLWVVEIGSQVLGGDTTPSITLHHTLCGHCAPIMSVRFSASGLLLASASGDKTVRLWDPMKQVPLGVLEGHKRYVTSCAFSDDGALVAAGSGDRVVKVWRVDGATNPTHSSTSSTDAIRKLRVRFPSYGLRENTKLIEWSSEDLCEWLVEQGLAEYSHNFRTHAIDGRELLSVTDEVLENKLGVDALGHRNKIMRLIRRSQDNQAKKEASNEPPSEFLCPITQEMICDPVLCADGFTYERVAMEAWLASGKRTSPMTNEKLAHVVLTPNRTLRTLIQKYREDNI
ncbi:WD repeat, SAM and U-box domain-containing protein 1-like isoform X3 [Eriocheir sinensis]|uniref:WD repeat, SAM and U-box domain-containing protein 1-like isoform X3 n=1 Tax=Eriocheir sinensis TaxID=95602 RepID=UPI0021C5CFEB|nr:WD repeat, SAM and U-box domain-containing protein 1-like isoform X3 [Eriocheir sinensis]